MTAQATGWFVLVELDEVDQTIKDGALAGFQTASNEEHEREQRGHHKGRIINFGPICYACYNGIDAETAEGRAAQWGVKIGDEVEVGRYAGEMLQKDGVDRYMLVPDQKIMGVLGDE